MDFQLVVTLSVFFVVVLCLLQERIGPDVVMITGLLVLVGCGVLKMDEALAGFASPSVVTIGSLFVVGAGLRSTGGLETISLWMLGRPTARTSLFRLLVPIAGLSAFMNNTPLVAFFLPIFVGLAKRLRISPSRLLIPLSYSAILGGCCTLVGTSTNLVVDGILQKNQLPGMSMFELTPVGLPIAIIGLIYLVTMGPRLLPDREDLLEHIESHRREYLVEMMIRETCPLVGQTIRQSGLRDLPGLYLYRIERDGQTLSPVSPSEVMQIGDLLCFSGIASTVVDLQKIRALDPVDHKTTAHSDDAIPVLTQASLDSFEGVSAPSAPQVQAAPRSGRQLCEVVISSTSPLIDQSIRDSNFRSRYNASVLAVHRSGEKLEQKIGKIVLRTGDTLLIDADDDFVRRWRHSPDFVLVSGVEDSAPVAHDRAWVALLVFFAVILGMSFVPNWLNLIALGGAVLMVICGCTRGSDAHRSIELSVILLVGAALGIGLALEKSGAAKWMAQGLLSACGNSHPIVVLAVIYFLTVVLSEFLSNNATAAMMGQLALAAAAEMDVHARPFLIGVAIASSCAFATPIGYQTNLMVLNPGGYRFIDYLKVGLPLNVLCMVIALILIPLIWGF